MNQYDSLINIAKDNSCGVKLNEPMYKHTSFKIGGCADVFLEINNTNSLKKILQHLHGKSIPFRVIGNGSNLLIDDKGLSCVILKLCDKFNEIQLSNETEIISGSAIKLSELCNFALKNSLSGLEFAYGIPGTVGGAIFMNAGAYGGEMKDVVCSCCHINSDLKEEELPNNELDFSYRHSRYSDNNDIITAVKFKLFPAEKDSIHTKMQDFLNRRKSKQPLEYPSAGSVFRRPEGYFAGTLIEECGLKGKNIGGAEVSTKHAGFIINKGNASCSDVTSLIKYIQDTVQEKKNVRLTREVKIWKD